MGYKRHGVVIDIVVAFVNVQILYISFHIEFGIFILLVSLLLSLTMYSGHALVINGVDGGWNDGHCCGGSRGRGPWTFQHLCHDTILSL